MPYEKIDVDININADSLKSLPQYKAGFDGLRDAVNKLSSEVLKASENLIKLNNQNKEATSWGAKVGNTVKNLKDSFETFQGVIEIAKAGFAGWTNALSLGFSLITTFGPQILDFLSEMFQSEKSRQAAQALKDYNDVMAEYIGNVSGEISQLGMLLNVANNKNLSDQTRIEAVRQLNALSPQHLNNLTLENLKTKEGIALVKEYTNALNRKAMEEAIQSKRTEIVKQRYELKEEYDRAKLDVNKYRSGKLEDGDVYNPIPSGGTVPILTTLKTTKREEAEAHFTDLAKKDKQLVTRLNKLDADLAGALARYAPKIDPMKTRNKQYWDVVVNDQQRQLDKLDTSSKDFDARSKPIIARIKEARVQLAKFSVGTDVKVHQTTGKKQAKPERNLDEEARLESIARLAALQLQGYDKEVALTNQHFDKLVEAHKHNKKTVEQLETERVTKLKEITDKFQQEGLAKLDEYTKELTDVSRKAGKTDTELELQTLQENFDAKNAAIREQDKQSNERQAALSAKLKAIETTGSAEQIAIVKQEIADEEALRAKAAGVRLQIEEKFLTDKGKLGDKIAKEKAEHDEQEKEEPLKKQIDEAREGGHESRALQEELRLLEIQHKFKIEHEKHTEAELLKIRQEYTKKKAELEEKLQLSRIHAGDKFIDAALKNSKKDSAIFKAAFLAKKAVAIADTIVTTKRAVMDSLKAYSGIPFIGTALGIAQAAFMAAQGASSIAEIAKQKPGFARGGRYISDGRGALLSGYSRHDDTNAYLRSGEAVVVSEAMRNPWARNLVSAINVAHGGRDFSIANPGSGYAIGGIYTDGGNANRYYSQPVNDVKDLANTLAYQMINNFPPVYVDVKDINTQQNILAKTVDRVTL